MFVKKIIICIYWKKKYQRSQSPDLEHLEDDSDQGDDISSDEETNEMSQKVKELLAAEKENQDNSSTEEEDTSEDEAVATDQKKAEFSAKFHLFCHVCRQCGPCSPPPASAWSRLLNISTD